MDFIALLFALGVGFGLSCWIFGTILEKSNNLGDSHGGSNDYKAYPYFTVRRDKMSKNEQSYFSSQYAEKIDTGAQPSGASLVRRLTDEEREKYKKPAETPTGLFQPGSKSTWVDTTEEEIRNWDKNAGEYKNLAGIFKPVSDQDIDPNP